VAESAPPAFGAADLASPGPASPTSPRSPDILSRERRRSIDELTTPDIDIALDDDEADGTEGGDEGKAAAAAPKADVSYTDSDGLKLQPEFAVLSPSTRIMRVGTVNGRDRAPHEAEQSSTAAADDSAASGGASVDGAAAAPTTPGPMDGAAAAASPAKAEEAAVSPIVQSPPDPAQGGGKRTMTEGLRMWWAAKRRPRSSTSAKSPAAPAAAEEGGGPAVQRGSSASVSVVDEELIADASGTPPIFRRSRQLSSPYFDPLLTPRSPSPRKAPTAITSPVTSPSSGGGRPSARQGSTHVAPPNAGAKVSKKKVAQDMVESSFI